MASFDNDPDVKVVVDLKSRIICCNNERGDCYKKSVLEAFEDCLNDVDLPYSVFYKLLCEGIDGWLVKPREGIMFISLFRILSSYNTYHFFFQLLKSSAIGEI